MKQVLEQLSLIWRELGLNQRVSIVLAGLAVIGGLAGILLWANRPQMKLLYGGLPEKEAGEVVAALQDAGVEFEIGAGGRSIYVSADQVYKARMDLAAKGLPNADGVGFEIFDRTNFGISDFVQRTNYSRALQGELARTIAQVRGVRSARVLLVTPESRLLLRGNEVRPTASVFVDTGSQVLETSAVSSIRSMVANAVQGLQQQDVSVVDNNGTVLSEALNSDPMLGSASSQMKHRKQVEDYFSQKVETMLAKVLGAGAAVVRVSAEINSDISSRVEEKWDPESQVANTENLIEDNTTTSESTGDAGGEVGVGVNTPQKQAGGADANSGPKKSSVTNRSSKTLNYHINKAVTNTTKNPGEVTRLTASVFLAPPAPKDGATQAASRTAEELASLRMMVANALGITAKTPQELEKLVSVAETPFAPVTTAALIPESSVSGILDTVGPVAALAIAVIVFLMFFMNIKKTRPDEITFELVDETEPQQQSLLPAAKDHKISPDILNDLIRRKPDNVGATIREWLATKNAS